MWYKCIGEVRDNRGPNPSTKHCSDNIVNYIINLDPLPDLMAFQEATRWKDKLLQKLNNKGKYNYVEHNSGPETIATVYNTDKLDVVQTYKNQFGNGRPFMFNYFESTKGKFVKPFLFINIHAGHGRHTHDQVSTTINDLTTPLGRSMRGILPQYKQGRIIMAGDFNEDFNSSSAKWTEIKTNKFVRFYRDTDKTPTCCSDDNSNTHHSKYDWLLDNTGPIMSHADRPQNASDHLPLHGTVQMQILQEQKEFRPKVGYDFDGVLHTSVGPPDKHGGRHPVHPNGGNPFTWAPIEKPFTFFIDEIKNRCNTHDIYIITARSKSILEPVRTYLDHFGLTRCLKHPVVSAEDKATAIRLYGITEFYDDSLKNIAHIAHAFADKLGNITIDLYFVVPENAGVGNKIKVPIKNISDLQYIMSANKPDISVFIQKMSQIRNTIKQCDELATSLKQRLNIVNSQITILSTSIGKINNVLQTAIPNAKINEFKAKLAEFNEKITQFSVIRKSTEANLQIVEATKANNEKALAAVEKFIKQQPQQQQQQQQQSDEKKAAPVADPAVGKDGKDKDCVLLESLIENLPK
jgi:endonuclease/exonuclease/phosphatase family metal-dependent hydrolase